MMIPGEEPLLVECNIKQQRDRKQARKKRRPLLLNGSRLVGNFSEFLASKNVINGYSRYDKIVSCHQTKSAYEQQQDLLFDERPLRYNLSQQHSASFDGTKVIGPLKQTKRTRFLLKALISRNQANKRTLLISLLRAPIVLAALFSLLLVASIMILYTMSFHHTHCPSLHQQIELNQTRERNVGALEEQAEEPHVISSRHLLQSSTTNNDRHEPNSTIEARGDGFERTLTVQTECGSFIGSPESRAIIFKGIPYASPPVGRRRWTRPRPIWLDPELCKPNDTSEAWEYKQHCAQLSPVTRRFSGHEDCLYLDIYAPKLDLNNQAKKLPVMVYIHGGFLSYGSSGQGENVNWMKARPSGLLAAELNVVLVAFNYRLQALGFMTLLQLAQNNGPDGSEGNYGLWDQLAALNWIKRNIESFGGNPDNIVLFGPDSASSLPLALIGRLHHESDHHDLVGNNTFSNGVSKSVAEELHEGNLFRAVWLTNPTVFYELPYELANKHYQRLFLNQSPCRHETSDEIGASNSNTIERSNATERIASELARKQSDELRECLMSLTSEQVVRYYLAKDDPSYRLDDQNSLPIHGIFAEQFVTIDRELVQDSYPFGRRTADSYAPRAAASEINGASNLQAHYGPATNADADAVAPANDITSNWQGNYNDNCERTGGQKCRQRRKPDLLLGSTAQAVEYWPCPRNLDQWTWDDFKRYVATSLNSFISDTYKRASELYQVPLVERNDSGIAGPKETYLTMVSDIRQTCAINELAESLRGGQHQVQRYIIKQRPSKQRNVFQRGQKSEAFRENENKKFPEFAFHTWDLLAFFGFQFEPDFEPTQQDFNFQAHIRQMVQKFVNVYDNYNKTGDNSKSSYLIFQEDGTMKQVAHYKEEECGMWQRHLSRSYAWVS